MPTDTDITRIYGYNNPIRYIDPTGNDLLGSDWLIEFQQRHRRDPEWYDRAIRLFSIVFPEEWSWEKFYDGYGNLQSETVLVSIFKDVTAKQRCWEEMPNVFERLTQWYEPAEEAFFVHDIAFLFAGYDLDQTTFLFHRYLRITKDYGTGRSR